MPEPFLVLNFMLNLLTQMCCWSELAGLDANYVSGGKYSRVFSLMSWVLTVKTVVMTGFGKITLLDLDTIDLSNLNRQFLFKKKDVKQSKALVRLRSYLIFIRFYWTRILIRFFVCENRLQPRRLHHLIPMYASRLFTTILKNHNTMFYGSNNLILS
jgi:ThiF family